MSATRTPTEDVVGYRTEAWQADQDSDPDGDLDSDLATRCI
jgi:hypothetical protein